MKYFNNHAVITLTSSPIRRSRIPEESRGMKEERSCERMGKFSLFFVDSSSFVEG